MERTLRRRLRIAFLATTVLVVALLAWRRVDPLPRGLRATYYASDNWTGAVQSRLDPEPSTERLYQGWNLRPPEVHSIIWQGALAVLRGGPHTFSVTADDGAWVYVDDRPCLELPALTPTATAACTVDLEQGIHGLQVRYVQRGGEFDLAVSWAREGQMLAPLTERWLVP